MHGCRGSPRCQTPCRQEVGDSAVSCFGGRMRARFEKNRKLHKDVSVGCLLANATGINSCAGSTVSLLSSSLAAWEMET